MNAAAAVCIDCKAAVIAPADPEAACPACGAQPFEAECETMENQSAKARERAASEIAPQTCDHDPSHCLCSPNIFLGETWREMTPVEEFAVFGASIEHVVLSWRAAATPEVGREAARRCIFTTTDGTRLRLVEDQHGNLRWQRADAPAD